MTVNLTSSLRIHVDSVSWVFAIQFQTLVLCHLTVFFPNTWWAPSSSLFTWAREWFQATFYYQTFLLPRTLHSPFYRQGSRRCAEWSERKLNEIKADRSDAPTSRAVTGWQQPGSAQRLELWRANFHFLQKPTGKRNYTVRFCYCQFF